jgi:gamma-D-glutamyl-L-lysine dipeptidyl-peptidase
MIDRIYELAEQVRLEFAPDARVAVFEVEAVQEGGNVIVFGASSIPAAVEALHSKLATLEPGVAVRDEILRLPAAMGGRPPHALVRVAVAPMLAAPIISGSYLSTTILGHRVLVLREYGRWQQCRSADGYVGWMHRGYLCRLTEADARAWDVGTRVPLHVSLGGEVLDGRGDLMLRLPWGARIGMRDGAALLPDGRQGPLRGDAVPFEELAVRFPPSGDRIVTTALTWTGTPYLWGGTTPWGADCSGIVQAVYRVHGIELPRDSDQQAREGTAIEPDADFGNIQAGDLHFFAERENRISHVAISMGGSKIVHSALGNGGVGVNDLTGENGYERSLRELLVSTRRVIPPAP